MSVHDIQQKGLENKISVDAFTHPDDHHRVAKATLFVTCTRDGCATFRSPVMSSEVTWIMWSPLWRSSHLPNSEIFISNKNAFFIVTVHIVTDAVDATYWGTGITMGILFTFLRMSTSVQVHLVARWTNGVSWEAKNNMVLRKICGCHFCPLIFDKTKGNC